VEKGRGKNPQVKISQNTGDVLNDGILNDNANNDDETERKQE
jgi:hypothetical protein